MKWRNYGLWVSVASIVYMVLRDIGMQIDLTQWQTYVTAILGILATLGVISNPEQGRGYFRLRRQNNEQNVPLQNAPIQGNQTGQPLQGNQMNVQQQPIQENQAVIQQTQQPAHQNQGAVRQTQQQPKSQQQNITTGKVVPVNREFIGAEQNERF